ncbi:MAG: rhodanese-like domain-containing protein [Fidelibacterota bacterium]
MKTSSKTLLIGLLLVGLLGILGFTIAGQGQEENGRVTVVNQVPSITVEGVRARMAEGKPFILDVRTVPEYDGPLGHIEGSYLIPVQELENRLEELEPYKDQELIVVCRSGNRSRRATKLLNSYGFKAINMLGGMKAWKATPEATPKSVPSDATDEKR